MSARKGGGSSDEDHGLTPREWLEHDAVPLTPDVDLTDPEQRRAWIRANNEEMYQRGLELRQRRRRGPAGRGSAEGADPADLVTPRPVSSTTVIALRVQNAEHRALVRLARREAVTVSDLVRRWVRAGLEAAYDVDPDVSEPDERERLRAALADAADATVERITDELRRWRELVTDAG